MHSTESANIDDAMVLGFVGLLVVICDGFGRGGFLSGEVAGGRTDPSISGQLSTARPTEQHWVTA